ncbi:Iron-sulfur cluster repair protein ScdA [Novipirellula aureliae]|uniref:Iron-sulfur cluster repair protein ScdA n=1 Tax=Novipirellula aureliae TaxID=2527966 RepID=A0A5C6EBQ8_9BACT|nr:DUF542 domain-containing protein [Novipirellula aureliae]TWU45854.1 Iron-sulfur cluster repair protein ScdA [Novipirellula aureliae]
MKPSESHYTKRVGQWVAEHPQTADVFEMLRIDYCCDGDKTLEQASWEHGLELLRVHSLLQRTIAEIEDASVDDWLHASLSGLCDHIEQKHHAYLKNTLPTLTSLIAEVVEVYGDAHAELGELQDYFVGWRSEILNVMAMEERDLFPAIRQLDEATFTGERFGRGDDFRQLSVPIRRVIYDHEDIGQSLRSARVVAADYKPPSDAGQTYRQMLGLLRRVETDTRHHVHKENYILFPRVLDLVTQSAA